MADSDILFDAGSLTWYIGEDLVKSIEDGHLNLLHGSDYVEK